MLKTALSIIQNTMKLINEPFPTALVGETDPNTLQLIQMLYKTCEELRRLKTFDAQKRKYNFTTTSADSTIALPADFYSPLLGTLWNADTDEPLTKANDAAFVYYLQSGNTPADEFSYRIFGWDENTASGLGQFEVSPTPSSTVNLYMEYVTRHLFLPKHYALSTAYAQNTLVNVSGNIYKCATAITASDTVPTGTSTAIEDDDGTWDWYNTPIEALQADTDLCLFDYDIVELGVKEKYLKEMGGSGYAVANADYKRAVEDNVNRNRGVHIGSFYRTRSLPGPQIPYKSWSVTGW